MKILRRVVLLPLLFLLAFSSVSYAIKTSSNIIATVTIVGVKPVIKILSPTNATYNTEGVPLNFTINEPVIWIAYSLDNAKNKTIKGNTTLRGLKDGAHNIVIYALDNPENVGASNKVYFSYCLGDVNGDKKIDTSDLILILNHLRQNCKSKNYNSIYDLNGDCSINAFDMFIALSNYGKTCKI